MTNNETANLLDLFLKGGILMYPILFCSIIALVIVVERFLILRKSAIDAGQFMLKLRSVLQRGNIMEGINFCSRSSAPLANILRKGLTKFPEGHDRIREAIENAGKEETFKLEHRLGILASIAGIAPLLGFLGTVTGMIGAFRTIQERGGAVNPGDLAGGIWEALLTTAFGLLVGIVAYGFYNYFVNRVGRFVYEMENGSEEFLDLVVSGQLDTEPEKEAPRRKSSAPSDEYFQRKPDR
ncbi:MAG: MotA/TolQ/ExbB proton channel family protein [Ignavibacteriales bacterium]|nr:MotA/TolQ/ExbB proton channel family protein [Ignavibacteriales bacterium]